MAAGARSVGHAGADDRTLFRAEEQGGYNAVETRGLSGFVKHNYVLETPTMLSFAGVKQEVRGISVLDIGGPTRNVGVEVSGFLGFKTLRELIIAIDYRDNLVKITFDASKGFHSKGNFF